MPTNNYFGFDQRIAKQLHADMQFKARTALKYYNKLKYCKTEEEKMSMAKKVNKWLDKTEIARTKFNEYAKPPEAQIVDNVDALDSTSKTSGPVDNDNLIGGGN